MNQGIFEYYQKNSDAGFTDVIVVDENCLKTYEELKELAYNFPKAWWELTKLEITDKIEFSRDFCLKTLPYSPESYPSIYDFFNNLNNIHVVMTKKTNEKYVVELVYSIQNNTTFFRGKPPLSSEMIRYVNSQFNDILPADFLAFLKIHSGFAKNADTGIIEAENIFDVTQNIRQLIISQNKIILSNLSEIDPQDLIFFYQSIQRVDFQCFYTRWVPHSQIGNVYFSYNDNSVSDISDKNMWAENLAFPTFLQWLIFYLEIMDFE